MFRPEVHGMKQACENEPQYREGVDDSMVGSKDMVEAHKKGSKVGNYASAGRAVENQVLENELQAELELLADCWQCVAFANPKSVCCWEEHQRRLVHCPSKCISI